MPGIRVLLVEDDWIIAKEISLCLQDLGFELVAHFDNGEEALEKYALLQPQIILLDIGLAGKLTGIDTAREIKKQSAVPFIFLTALADPTTIEQAKIAEPYAYLVKPVKAESLYSAIEIALHNAAQKQIPAASPLKENLSMEDGIFVKSNKRLEKILLKDILWIEAFDIYAMVITATDKYMLSTSLKTVEDKFPATRFIRVHRSYIVNLERVNAIEETDLIINGASIPVGKTYKDKVMGKISIL